MQPYTQVLPKPLIPVLGVPTVRYSAELLLKSGVGNFVSNIHHLPEIAKKGLAGIFSDHKDVRLSFSDERALILGSAGGIRTAFPLLNENRFLIMNGDVIASPNLSLLEAVHQKAHQAWGATLTLCLTRSRMKDRAYRQIHVDPQSGQVTGAGEVVKGEIFYSGVAVAEKSAFQHLAMGEKSEFLEAVLLPAIERKKVAYCIQEMIWEDVGDPDLWKKAHFYLMEKFEQKGLPPIWQSMLAQANHMLSPGIWTRATSWEKQSTEKWKKPCYWAGKGQSPKVLEAENIIYSEFESVKAN